MDKKNYVPVVPGYEPVFSETHIVTSPFDGSNVAELALLDSAAMNAALDVASNAKCLPAYQRAEILQATADIIGKNQEKLAQLIAREGGKPVTDARIEVVRAENTVRLCAEEATRIQGEEVPMNGTKAALGRLAFTTREPIGVVAAVSAFNHPVNLIAHQVATAVAAGCPVLIKPALDTPLSCIEFIDALYEAGLPQELAIAVPCANDVAEQLVISDQLGLFSFIGSARVGWALRAKVAAGVRCALEHGGAAPVIVDESADLDSTVPMLVKGGYYHAGQVCVSVQRIFVHQSRKDELIKRLKEAVCSLIVGDPNEDATEVGPLIRGAEVERVGQWVDEAVAVGAELICGGAASGHQVYQPTLLVDPPLDSKVMQQEIFGPVVCVTSFDDISAAIDAANDVEWAFQAAVFAQDIDVALNVSRQLNASAVMVNDHTAFRVDWMPFGGRKGSGLSMGGVADSIREMTQEKLIVLRVKS